MGQIENNEKIFFDNTIEIIDKQIIDIEKSKKGKDQKYKYGADAAITNLVVTKIKIQKEFKKYYPEKHFPCLDFLHGQERCNIQCENCKP